MRNSDCGDLPAAVWALVNDGMTVGIGIWECRCFVKKLAPKKQRCPRRPPFPLPSFLLFVCPDSLFFTSGACLFSTDMLCRMRVYGKHSLQECKERIMDPDTKVLLISCGFFLFSVILGLFGKKMNDD